jgi:CarD family transcriptional regulator
MATPSRSKASSPSPRSAAAVAQGRKDASAAPGGKADATQGKATTKPKLPAKKEVVQPGKAQAAKTAAKPAPASKAASVKPPSAKAAPNSPTEATTPAAEPAAIASLQASSSKVMPRPVTKPKASISSPATPAGSAAGPGTGPEPAAAPAAPCPSIIIVAPTDTPSRGGNSMSSRSSSGRPNMPPSFAVRSPGRPGFAEGQAPAPRPIPAKIELKAGDHVVYPTHGVGMVQGIETIEAAGHALQMVVVTFEENRMTLRVPVTKVATAGLRKLFTQKEFEQAIDTLKGRARIKRTMWSRRAQEYEAKINSGDPIQIAEVVRDLQRNAGQPDQSFSERQIYEQALERLAAEYAAIEKIDRFEASERLVVFAKSST